MRFPRRRTRRSAALVAATIAVATAVTLVLTTATEPPGHRPATARTPPIVRTTVTFVDHARATPARGPVPARSGRVLRTEIVRVADARHRPLVVFLHGYDSTPDAYTTLLDALARAGYVVAAPFIPSSTSAAKGTPVSDYPAQARDASFVIGAVERRFAALVDAGAVAVCGHSDGATDVALLALNPRFADPRIRAYLVLAGEIPADVRGPWDARTNGSLLVAVSAHDRFGLHRYAVGVYEAAHMPKVMIVARGDSHLGVFAGRTKEADAMRADLVAFLTAAFRSPPPSERGLRHAIVPARAGVTLAPARPTASVAT